MKFWHIIAAILMSLATAQAEELPSAVPTYTTTWEFVEDWQAQDIQEVFGDSVGIAAAEAPAPIDPEDPNPPILPWCQCTPLQAQALLSNMNAAGLATKNPEQFGLTINNQGLMILKPSE